MRAPRGRQLLRRVARHPWRVLGWWTVTWTLVQSGSVAGSWHYLRQGAELLLDGGRAGGLHLYASQPQLQIGPLSFLLAIPFGGLPPWAARYLAALAMTAVGPLALAAVVRMLPPGGRTRRRAFIAGALLVPVWTDLGTHTGHLDDVLALGLSVLALQAMAGRRYELSALLLAAAADSKPWAAAFVAVLLVVPREHRRRALLCWLGGLAVAWGPFILADPHTLLAARFTIPNAASSALRALGVAAARTPLWDRPLQLVLGTLAGAVAVRRHRPAAVLLVAVAVRVMLDPSVYAYYTSGLVLAAVTFDLLATRLLLPWATLGAVVLVYLPRLWLLLGHGGQSTAGLLRLGYTVGAVMAVLALPRSRLWPAARPDGAQGRGPATRPPASPRSAVASRAATAGANCGSRQAVVSRTAGPEAIR